MADPICRWRNPYFKTVRELISALPKEDLSKTIARQLTIEEFGSEDFFRTPYQLAAQLGLYYEDDLIFFTKFHYNPHPFEINKYLDCWFNNYYVPNPYTVRGFENIEPKIINVEICKLLFNNQKDLEWQKVKLELFGEIIGNDDILINVINNYSALYQVKNNYLKLRDGIEYLDLEKCIYEYNLPKRNDKKGFFDHFNIIDLNKSNNISSEISSEYIIISESHNLRQIVFDSFKYLFDNFDETKILEDHKNKSAKIEERSYIGITFPKYFGFEIIFGQFENEQSAENLKSSGTRRFFLDNFTLFNNDYNYLNNQWYEDSDRALTLSNLNKYLSYVSSNTLKIIKVGNLFKLINVKILVSNKIYYGAPGTGKSYKVDSIIKELDPKFYERVTFHPEFDNASFVGGYKPVSEEVDGNEVIKYKFVPQAFANIYSRAWKDLENPYYLVIEEINRGNCAEIFGEIFQLLDRNSNYSVTPSKELKEHLIKEFEDNIQHDGIVKGLKLPSNLHILATMNTSDQSLYPMDSAFKRRWDWEYIPICYDEKNDEGEDNPSYHYVIDLGDGTKYKWINFISVINNNHIKDNPSLGMDKCIGNYFVKPLDGNIIELKPFINKVIFYLWNDVFKDEENKVFEKNTSYEDFFPISTNGLKKVKELFERIGLEPIPSESLYEDKDEGEELKQVAEEREPLA